MIGFFDQPAGIKNVHYWGLNRLEWLFVFSLFMLFLVALIFVRAYVITKRREDVQS